MRRTTTFAAVAAFALAAPAAFAQRDRPVDASAAAPKAPVDDLLFASVAACGGMHEVALAELGLKKATDPVLKKFSQQMIDSHTKMNRELMALASQKQVTLPKGLDDKSKFCTQSLAGLSGEEFDACYAKAQLVAHMEAMAAFEAEAERGQDPEMKALAAKALPHIKGHFKEIKPIAIKYVMEMKEEKVEQKIDRELRK